MKNKLNEYMWGEKMEIVTGMPIVLTNAKGLEKYPLWEGQEGMANSLVNIDDVNYVYFMPDNAMRVYVIREDKVKINEDKIEAWLEVNS